MSVATLSDPGSVELRLNEIDQELAEKANEYELAALLWFRAKRDKERQRAIEFRKATGSVAERTARAEEETALLGAEYEATFESLKAAMRVLETRASIGQSILRSQSRVGA